ncbi:MAG TPA: TonB family protein [Thermoanaerobaculia bacterium]|nr:TonB family protein [Thermoanaerobaculia bacterium]
MALLSEQIDGKYEILGKLREGGMGSLYKVRHRLLDEVRVVKVIRSQADAVGEEGADRFLREARAAIRLRHPNVAVLHDFAVSEDGQAFIVMEHIDGWNLLEVLSGYGPPPVPLTLEIARQSLKALGYLHRHKIVHRDVSPDNLMLTRDVDGHPLVKLIDLGIAKALEGQGGLTTTGVFLGKPRYGSPERFSGAGWDERSDLYSFGVVLYELLTGRPPITGNDPASLMAGHLFRPPVGFAESDPEGRVPPELRSLVLRALAKNPEERVASAEELVWELTMLQDRFPLSRQDLDRVWGVLLPLGTGSLLEVALPGSTQDRLNLELGLGRTPPAGTVTAEATLRTAPTPGPPAEVIPFPSVTRAIPPSEPTRRVTPVEDLDATWIARPMRLDSGSARKTEVEEPAAAAPSRDRGIWIASAAAALVLAAGGLWWAPRPAPVPLPSAPPAVSSTVAPAKAPAAGPSLISVPVEAAKPAPPLAAPLAAEKKPVVRRDPLPEEPAPAATAQEPMQAGDLIRAGQKGVQAPEIQELPSYAYPQAAKGSGKRVTIRVAVLVDESGQVIDARVREGDRSGLGFEEAALEAARKARYFPATRDGVAGKMWTDLELVFEEP